MRPSWRGRVRGGDLRLGGEGDAWLDAATRVVYNLLTAAAAAGVRLPFFKRGRPWRPRDLLPRLCSPDGVLAGLLRCAPPSFSSTGVAQSPIARAQVRHIRILRESGRFQLETGGNAENSVEQLLNAHIGIPLVNTRDDGDAVMMTAPLPPAGGSVVCSSDSGDLVEKISEAVRPFGLARHPPPRRTDTPRTAPSGGAQHDGRRNGPQP